MCTCSSNLHPWVLTYIFKCSHARGDDYCLFQLIIEDSCWRTWLTQEGSYSYLELLYMLPYLCVNCHMVLLNWSIFRDEVKIPSAATPAVMDVQAALKAVLRSASFADGLAKGLHEAAKALDKYVLLSVLLCTHKRSIWSLSGLFSTCRVREYRPTCHIRFGLLHFGCQRKPTPISVVLPKTLCILVVAVIMLQRYDSITQLDSAFRLCMHGVVFFESEVATSATSKQLNHVIMMKRLWWQSWRDRISLLEVYSRPKVCIASVSSLSCTLRSNRFRREAHFCVLAENCDEPMYVKLVEALCNEHNIPLIKVADKKIIGEWCGLCKYDKEGKARKVVGCSCAVVKDYGNEELGKQVLQQYFDSKK